MDTVQIESVGSGLVPRPRQLAASFMFLLLELLKGSVGMPPHLVRSRLWKGFRLVAGASRDQQEEEHADGNCDPTLLRAASAMSHAQSPLP